MRVLALILALCLAGLAQADDDRRGFIGGLGGGWYNNTLSASMDVGGSGLSGQGELNGFATTVRLGYAPTSRFLFQYLRYATWSSGDLGGTYIIGISGLGATYYLRPTAPSLYLTLGLGLADVTDVGSAQASPGSGWLIALGFEEKPHLHFEGALMATRFDESGYDPYTGFYVDVQMSGLATLFTLQYLWY